MTLAPIISTRSALTRHPRCRLDVLATGSRYLSSRSNENWSSFDPRAVSTGWSRNERGKNVLYIPPVPGCRVVRGRLPKVTGTTVAVRATATTRHESRVRGYRSKEEDTENRESKKEKAREVAGRKGKKENEEMEERRSDPS